MSKKKMPRTHGELHQYSPEEQMKWIDIILESKDVEAICNHNLVDVCTPDEHLGEVLTLDEVKKVIQVARKCGLRKGWQPCQDVITFAVRNDLTGKVVEYLLSFGVKHINDVNINKARPVSTACSRGNVKGVKALFDACDKAGVKLDVLSPDSQGTEPLYWACQADGNNMAKGSLDDFADIIEMLVKRGGADLDNIMFRGKRGMSGLGRVCERANHQLAKRCIQLGADVNKASSCVNGMTPLHFAAYNGADKCVKLLLKAKADTRKTLPSIDSQGMPQVEGFIPIFYCISSLNMRIADMILRHEDELGLEPISVENGWSQVCVYQYKHMLQLTEKYRKTGDVMGGMSPDRVYHMCTPGKYTEQKMQEIRENEARSVQRTQELADKKKPHACSGCGNFGAGLKKCTGCMVTVYCSRECQVLHWKKGGHKQECAQLKSAAAAAAEVD